MGGIEASLASARAKSKAHVKRQKVADLVEQRRREREAAANKASMSDDVKTPSTDPASHHCPA